MLKRLLLAVQFLTILPVRVGGDVTEQDMARSAAAFTAVGFMQGALLVLCDVGFSFAFHPDLSIALLLLVLVLTNGGFHLDGLADTFDALAAKGDREKKLCVMRDGSTGAIGVTAVVFALALKYLSIRSVSSLSAYTYYSSLFFMPVFSKWAMVACMVHGRPAREDGLGRIFLGVRAVDAAISGTFLLLLLALPIVFLKQWTLPGMILFPALSFVLVYLLGLLLSGFFGSRFGGITGDTMGAVSEITEISYLWMVLLWFRVYTL